MTTALEHLPEPDTQSVARRLRAYMGEHKITRVKLAVATGISRSTLANKLDGHTELTLDEITAIAHALGKSWLWVLTGVDQPLPPEPTRYFWGLPLPRMDSNHQPPDYNTIDIWPPVTRHRQAAAA